MLFQKLRHLWYDGLLFFETLRLVAVRAIKTRELFFLNRREFDWLVRQLFGRRTSRVALRRMLLDGVLHAPRQGRPVLPSPSPANPPEEVATCALVPLSLVLLPGEVVYDSVSLSAAFPLRIDYSRRVEDLVRRLPDCLFANAATSEMFPEQRRGEVVVSVRFLTIGKPTSREELESFTRHLHLRLMTPLELVTLLLVGRQVCPSGQLYALGKIWVDKFGGARLVYAGVGQGGVRLFLAWPGTWQPEEKVFFPVVSET